MITYLVTKTVTISARIMQEIVGKSESKLQDFSCVRLLNKMLKTHDFINKWKHVIWKELQSPKVTAICDARWLSHLGIIPPNSLHFYPNHRISLKFERTSSIVVIVLKKLQARFNRFNLMIKLLKSNQFKFFTSKNKLNYSIH